MRSNQKVLILGTHLSGHNASFFDLLPDLAACGIEADVCMTANFAPRLANYPNIRLIPYPPETLPMFGKFMASHPRFDEFNPTNDRFLTIVSALGMLMSLNKFLTEWCLQNLNKKDYKYIVHCSFATWATCLNAEWKLPSLAVSATLLTPKSMFPKFDDEKTMNWIEEMNKDYGTQWSSATDLVTGLNQKLYDKIAVFTTEEFQYGLNELPLDRSYFIARSISSKYLSTKKCLRPGSMIYFCMGSVFNKDVELLKHALHTLGKFTQYKVLFSFGKAKDQMAIVEKENTYGHIETVEWTDQKSVLENASLFISHAGYGSVRESIEKLCPMILIPQFADQHDVADRLVELKTGVSVSTKDRKDGIERAIHKIEEEYDRYVGGIMSLQESFKKSIDGTELFKTFERDMNLN